MDTILQWRGLFPLLIALYGSALVMSGVNEPWMNLVVVLYTATCALFTWAIDLS